MSENRLEDLAFSLEKHLIPPPWAELMLSHFPEDVQRGLRDPAGSGGPIGLGYHESVGWFCLASGQGPYVVWTEYGTE